MATDADAGKDAGMWASARRLGRSALEMAEVRLALLATEVQQEKLRVLEATAWLALALLAAAAGLVLVNLFVLALVDERHRLAALGVLALLHAAGAAAAWRLARRRLAGSTPFAATLAELRQDRSVLAGGDAEAPR
jgi:uncharacterized membrane protein YqjE